MCAPKKRRFPEIEYILIDKKEHKTEWLYN